MDIEEMMLNYVKECVLKETTTYPDTEPAFIGALATVVFYTDYWRFKESQGRGAKSLADSAGIAITDTFVTGVLAEHAEADEGDFEEFREKYPPPSFI